MALPPVVEDSQATARELPGPVLFGGNAQQCDRQRILLGRTTRRLVCAELREERLNRTIAALSAPPKPSLLHVEDDPLSGQISAMGRYQAEEDALPRAQAQLDCDVGGLRVAISSPRESSGAVLHKHLRLSERQLETKVSSLRALLGKSIREQCRASLELAHLQVTPLLRTELSATCLDMLPLAWADERKASTDKCGRRGNLADRPPQPGSQGVLSHRIEVLQSSSPIMLDAPRFAPPLPDPHAKGLNHVFHRKCIGIHYAPRC